MNFTAEFKKLGKNDADIAGGKGASLGEMTQAGIPVPSGFVILSSAFEKFLEETDLNVEIDSILHSVNRKKIHTIDDASEKIKALILSVEIPNYLKKEIKQSFKKLNAKYVAVRSSATAEDSSSAAWAGQLDSYLNTAKKNLLENVKRCWASLFTPRAIFYRFEKNLHKQKISVAVVVQKMVESESSGIAFSVHPVTQDRNQIIIEAGFGLGEAIVSGQITPDSYVVEKEPRRIIDKNVQIQAKGLYRVNPPTGGGGNEWKDIPAKKGEKQVLSDKEIFKLSEIILNIENHYGFPCDIEWAFEKGKFYIVQSRPITTLTDKVKNNETIYVPFGKLIPSRARPKKISPPFPAMYTQEYVGTSDMEKMYGCRAHADILAWIGDDLTTSVDSFEDAENISEMIINKSLSDRHWLNKLIEWSEKQKDSLRDFIEKNLSSQSLPLLTNKEIAEKYFKYYKKYRDFHLKNTPSWWLGTQVLERELNKHVQEKNISQKDLGILIEPLYYFFDLNKEEESLLKIAIKLRDIKNFSEKNFPKEVKRMLDKHIKDYSSIPFAYVNGVIWDRKFFIDKIRHIISEEDPVKILKKKNEELELKKQKQNKLLEKLNLNKHLIDLIEISHKLSYLQDLKKIFQTRSHPHLQLVVLPEIAKRLNLYVKYMGFLTPYEIRDSLISGRISKELRVELPKRVANSILILKDNQYEWILENDAIKFSKKYGLIILTENVMEFNGNFASSGKVKGIARICKTSKEIGKIKKGDVLVASMTTPDYVPAMKIAGAIITDEGGITCHAAIIARELKKPCIIGTKIATQVLKDGDLVEVDANKGVVRIIKK